MRVRLTRKFSERIDGIDLSRCTVGDILELPDPEALCLIAERWAVLVDLDPNCPELAAAELVLPASARRREPTRRARRRDDDE